MKIQLLFPGLLVALSLGNWAQAQDRALPTPPATFYTPDFKRTTSDDSTAYCAETTLRDSLSGVMRVYYPSGKLRQYVPFADVYRGIRFGTLTTWYEDGQMCTKEDYVRGVRHGDLLTYYPDGTLKRRDHYENGFCGIGNCYGPDGNPVQYFGYEQLPLYPGGEAELVKELNKALHLTAEEVHSMRRDNHQINKITLSGLLQVDVELAVSPEGHIMDARVVHSTAQYLNGAALRAVAKLKWQFVPGRRDGQAMASYLTVPLYYNFVTERPYQQPNRQSHNAGARYR